MAADTEPPRSGPFPFPAVSHEPRIQQLHDDLVRAGHRPFHLPVGIDLDESDPEAGRCIRCNRFDGFPCLTDGKADAHVVCVRPALKHPNVTLRTHARVKRLEPDSSGRSVSTTTTGGRMTQSSRLGHIQMLGKSDRGILRTGAPRFAPRLALDYIAKHALDFSLTTEDLPDPGNRVTVDRQGNIHLAKIYHNTEPHKRLLAKLKDLLGPLGCRPTPIPRWSVLSQQIPACWHRP